MDIKYLTTSYISKYLMFRCCLYTCIWYQIITQYYICIHSPNEHIHPGQFVHFSMRHLLIFQKLYISRQQLIDIKKTHLIKIKFYLFLLKYVLIECLQNLALYFVQKTTFNSHIIKPESLIISFDYFLFNGILV